MSLNPLSYVFGFSRILTCTEPVSLCLPIVLFVLFWYFCTFSTSMLLFGTLGNNSRRKVEVVKLLILKYYLQFVVPITFMIRIRRKLSSIMVKSISTPKPGNLWTTSRLSVWPTGLQSVDEGDPERDVQGILKSSGLFYYVNFVVFRLLFLSIK